MEDKNIMIPKLSVDVTIEEKGKNRTKYAFERDLNGEMTAEDFLLWSKKTLILVADAALREEQAKGFDKSPVVLVDNNPNKRVEDVKPFGSIIFAARQAVNVVLRPIYERLIEVSPKLTGMYRDYNWVTYNGMKVASNLAEFDSWLAKKVPLKNGDIIRFINVMPYASKLEREGITATSRGSRRMAKSSKKRLAARGVTVRQPNGVYFLTARSIKRKFRFNSNIRFEWAPGRSMDLSDVPTVSRLGKPLRKDFYQDPKSKKKPRGPYVYPSITVRINERGFLE